MNTAKREIRGDADGAADGDADREGDVDGDDGGDDVDDKGEQNGHPWVSHFLGQIEALDWNIIFAICTENDHDNHADDDDEDPCEIMLDLCWHSVMNDCICTMYGELLDPMRVSCCIRSSAQLTHKPYFRSNAFVSGFSASSSRYLRSRFASSHAF